MDNLFVGVTPTGLVFCDRSRERDGDYLKVAFMSFRTLELTWYAECDVAMKASILHGAHDLRELRGTEYSIDACGHTVILGQ